VGLLRILPVLGVMVGALCACDPARGPVQPLLAGTWGGDNAGLIATDSSAHVHIGCTAGDVEGALQVGRDGRFDAAGRYNVTLYPVARGPDHPARFSGQIAGMVMTLFGKEPRMGVCPICRRPTH